MGELRNIINRYEKKNGEAGNGDVGGFMRSMGATVDLVVAQKKKYDAADVRTINEIT